MNENEVLEIINGIVKKYTKNFQTLVFEREDENAANYKAMFAVRMNTDDVSQQMIEEIKYLNARKGKKIFFEGTKVDVENNLEKTFVFVSASIKCNL